MENFDVVADECTAEVAVEPKVFLFKMGEWRGRLQTADAVGCPHVDTCQY